MVRFKAKRLAGFAVVGAMLLLVSALCTPPAIAASTVGHEDGTLSARFGQLDPTPPKPEHRLWYAHSSWWGSFPASQSTGYTIWQLTKTGAWVDTGIVVDRRSNSGADALYNGEHLFVATHQFTASFANATAAAGSLLRFTFSGGTWMLDKNFPVPMMNTSVAAVSVAQDSMGRILAAYVVSSHPWYVVTNSDADTDEVPVSFGQPLRLTWNGTHPDPAAGNLTGEDIVAVCAGNGFTTVIWSNQSKNPALNGYYAARHRDGATFRTESWTAMAVTPPGANSADNHVVLATIPGDSKGQVFAVLKTSKNDLTHKVASDPQLLFAVFTPTSPDDMLMGTWKTTTFTTVGQGGTRPVIVMDRSLNKARVFFAAPYDAGTITAMHNQGTIFEKDVDYATATAPPGRGTVVLRDGRDLLDDPTSTSQTVDAASGVVIEAYARRTRSGSAGRFWHSGAPGETTFDYAAADAQATPSESELTFPTSASGHTEPVPTLGSRTKDAVSKAWDAVSSPPGRYVTLAVTLLAAVVQMIATMRRRAARRRRRVARETYGFYSR
jgi:hypothetical protein